MTRRGKRFALSTAAVGLVILVAAGFAAKGWVMEEYYIHLLRSTDDEIRLVAAEALADTQSVRAAPYLIELLKKEPREKVFWSVSTLTEGKRTVMTPIAYALYRMGAGGLPSLTVAEQIEERRMLEKDGEVHWSSDEYLGILHEIRTALESGDEIFWSSYDSQIKD